MENKMKALVSQGDHNIKYTDVDIPMPEPNEIRIKVMASGICGGDLKMYQGHSDPKEIASMKSKGHFNPNAPRVGGHEYAGIVDMVGSEVTNIKVGQRVACYPTMYCTECQECHDGNVNLCDLRKEKKPNCRPATGGFAEYACFRAINALPLSDNVTYVQGAMLEPMGVSLHVINRAGNIEGKTVAIIGMGSLGFYALEAAKVKGAAKIIAIDVIDSKLKTASEHGAAAVYNSKEPGLAEKIRSECGPIDVVIETVMIEPTFDLAVHLVRNGGKISACGLGRFELTIPWRWMIDHEITLIPCITYTTEMHDSEKLIAEGKLDIDYIASVFPLKYGPQAFDDMEKTSPYIKVVFVPEHTEDK